MIAYCDRIPGSHYNCVRTRDMSVVVDIGRPEKEVYFALGILIWCRCVHYILADRGAVEVANGVGRGLLRIGCTHDAA